MPSTLSSTRRASAADRRPRRLETACCRSAATAKLMLRPRHSRPFPASWLVSKRRRWAKERWHMCLDRPLPASGRPHPASAQEWRVSATGAARSGVCWRQGVAEAVHAVVPTRPRSRVVSATAARGAGQHGHVALGKATWRAPRHVALALGKATCMATCMGARGVRPAPGKGKAMWRAHGGGAAWRLGKAAHVSCRHAG